MTRLNALYYRGLGVAGPSIVISAADIARAFSLARVSVTAREVRIDCGRVSAIVRRG